MSIFQRLFGRSRTNNSESKQSTTSQSQISDGRRRRQDVPYALPSDIGEGERLNLQHYLFRYALKGNFAAPLKDDISMILDIGSGTGIWGEEMAQTFPNARIFGLDMEPPQSLSLSAVAKAPPANYHFIQGNILTGIPFSDNTFDYTHQRMLALALPLNRWPQVLTELKRVTKPDGWIELLELSTTVLNAGPHTKNIFNWGHQFLSKRGIDASQMENLHVIATAAGWNNVQYKYLDLPLGKWERPIGALLEQDTLSAFGALKAGICGVLKVPTQTFDETLARLPAEWKQNQARFRFCLVCGQA